MSQDARILRVIVVSPGDVQAEREIVPIVVDEVNRWIGSFIGVRLEVGRWETNAHPGFNVEGPQGLIDPSLHIEDSDLLIGIFWKRFGTPTKDGTTGTEHEIRQAYEAWQRSGRPQMMVYFNQREFTPQSEQETDQIRQVLKFKRDFPTEGLWWHYKGKPDFERLLRNHLLNFIRDNFLVGRGLPASPDSNTVRQLQQLPPAPGLFIGRDEGLREVKQRLGVFASGPNRYSGNPLAVVRGLAGVGKSSLAAALAYDPEVRKFFKDGILWVSLGVNPSLHSVVAAWGRALGTDELLKVPSLRDAATQLATLLSQKQMLLIVDDVWQTEHAVAFAQLRGGQCAVLFTTRETEVAEAITSAGSAIYNLPVLTEDSALELLELLAPSVSTEYPKESRDLVRDLGCLPIALQVAGRTLNTEWKFGWGVKEMLSELRTGANIIKQEAPADRADLETQSIPTVGALFKQSTDRLDEFTRDCFAYLGAFAPKPATFDLADLKNVWHIDDPRPVVRELVNHGLLEPVGGRFQMHNMLVAHARSMWTDQTTDDKRS